MPFFHIILAVDKLGGIGYLGDMPWSFPLDTMYYQTKVTNHSIFPVVVKNTLIMGRKTFELLDKNPAIKNKHVSFYVITSQHETRNKQNQDKEEKVWYVPNLSSALDIIPHREHVLSEIYVLGGKSVYESAFSHPQCDKIYVTFLDGTFPCDLFLPIHHLPIQWKNTVSVKDINEHDHKEYQLTFKEGKLLTVRG